MNKIKKRNITIWAIFIVLAIQISNSNFNLQQNDSKNAYNDIVSKDDQVLNEKTAQIIGFDSFADNGIDQNISLFYTRNETFINENTADGGITISNPVDGWNMTNFRLNFTELYACEEYVPFEIRSGDGALCDDDDYFYATSFEIPNTCYIKNLSMFINYPGGLFINPPGIDSIFHIRIYNSTTDIGGNLIPHIPLDHISDQYTFDLTNKPYQQPVKWYQSNFTNVVLNISETVNNTFFAVFHAEYISNFGFVNEKAYLLYAFEEPDDEYDGIFLKRPPLSSSWEEQTGLNGLLKVNLAPISNTPSPDQVNVTVFDTPVESIGEYFNNCFYPHKENKFDIEISSSWFGDVYYNMTFEGNFKYNTYSFNYFNATVGNNVGWNSTLDINVLPDDANYFNKIARFYKPSYWNYSHTYNGSTLFSDSNVQVTHTYVDLFNISNNVWAINYNQTNTILSKTIKYSSDQINWDTVNGYVNITDFINVSVQLNNSNGYGRVRVTTSKTDIDIQKNIDSNNLNFPIWRPDLNTTATENNTRVDVQILVFNGTMAGFEKFSFHVILSELNITLLGDLSNVLKNNLAYYYFSSQNLYNDEFIDYDDIIIRFKSESGQWDTLVKNYHYFINDLSKGKYNITIDTSLSYFIANSSYSNSINFTITSQYYYNKIYSSNLIIYERTHNSTILGSNKEDRIFRLGDSAIYQLFLNDSIKGNGIDAMDIYISWNYSGVYDPLPTNSYIINDFSNGNYNITIYTDILFLTEDLKNITLKFYSEKVGIYSLTIQTDILKIYNIGRNTSLEILANSSNYVIYGMNAWIDLKFYDPGNLEKEFSDAVFTIYNNSISINSDLYTITKNINIFRIIFLLENLEISKYNFSIEAHKPKEGKITYIDSQVNFELTYLLANFSVQLAPLPELYPDDTSKFSYLNVSYIYGPITDALIDVYLGPNRLALASIQPGYYKIFLDSTDLNMSKSYYFNVSVTREKFNDYINNSIILTISPYPSNITIPVEYQNINIYQEQILEIIVILKDTYNLKDILDAQVIMELKDKTMASEYFEALASNFGWYRGTLAIGNLIPGRHELTINMTAPNYLSSQTSVNITVLERKDTEIDMISDLNSYYVIGDTITIEIELSENGNEISGKIIEFEITETKLDGEVNTESYYDTTDKDGIAKIDYLIGDIESFKVKVIFAGEAGLRASTHTEDQIEIRSTTEQFIIDISPFIPFMIGAIIGITGYKLYRRSQKKKERLLWIEKSNIYFDAINIKYILLLHKISGNALVQKDLGKLEIDGSLIGGLLQAITLFLHGLKKEVVTGEERDKLLFDYKDFKVLLEDGELSRGILILDSEPSENIRKALILFIKQFEDKYFEVLKKFDGQLVRFKDFISVANEIFKISLIEKHTVNKNPPNIKVTPIQYTLLSIAKTYELLSGQSFYIHDLIEYGLPFLSDHSKEEIIANLLDLIDNEFIIYLKKIKK